MPVRLQKGGFNLNFGTKLKNVEAYNPTEYNGEIRLDANESCFDLPQEIKDEIAENIKKIEFNRYPDPNATELCAKFASYFGINAKNVLAGNGSDELLSLLFGAILRPNSFVMLVTPDFSMYKFYADLYGQNSLVFNKPINTKFEYKKALSLAQKADMIVFSNPCNPTSTGAFKKDILELVSSVSGIVVADEAYMDFWDESVINHINRLNNLIVLKTCSKAFGIAAARVGFAVANENIIEMFKKAKSPYNVSTLDQVAAMTVLSHPQYLKERTQQLIEQRNKLYNGLKPLLTAEMQMPEPKTNFVRISTFRAQQIYDALREKGIITRCLGENILRISVGTDDEINTLLKAFKEVTK